MKREGKERNRSSAKGRIRRFAVFMICLNLIGSDISPVCAKTPVHDDTEKGGIGEVITLDKLRAESAGNACRPGSAGDDADDIILKDNEDDLRAGESKDEMEDQDKDEPEDEGSEEEGGQDASSEGCDSIVLPRTVSVDIFEDDEYETLLFNGTCITLSGGMPEEVTAKAYPVEVSIEGIDVLASYDITVYDADGDIWQPEEGSIEVTIDNKDIRDAISNERDIAVFHIDQDAEEIEEIELFSISSRKARFTARHFSIYIVGDTGLTDIEGQKTGKYIFDFYGYPSGENDKAVSTQSVTADEYLAEPAVEELAHHIFNGWFTEPDGNGEKFDFNETAGVNLKRYGYGTDEENVFTVSLYADYSPVFYVYFMTQEDENGAGESSVFFTGEYHEDMPHLETADASGLYQESYLKTDGKDSYYAITGWYCYDEKGEKMILTEGSILYDDLVLYPEIQAAVWVYFDMNGAETSEVDVPAPVYVLPCDRTIGENFPHDPERPGYSFTGWYTKDGTQVCKDTDIALIEKTEGSICLFAGWTEAKAGYTVNIWRQKAESSIEAKEKDFGDYREEYDIAETIYITPDENASLETGCPVSAVCSLEEWGEWTGYADDTVQNSRYLGFEYNECRTLSELGIDRGREDKEQDFTILQSWEPHEGTATISGDGSTAVNIYYDRVTITWNFYGRIYGQPPAAGDSGKADLTLCGLWGADLKSGDWPSASYYKPGCIWCYSGTSYRFDTSYKYLYLEGSAIPLKDVDFYLKSVEKAGTLKIYREILEKEGTEEIQSVTLGGVTKYYELYTTDILIMDNKYGISEKFNTHHAAGYTDTAQPNKGFIPVNTNNGTVKPEIKVDHDTGQEVCIYYDLNSYDLTFYSNGEKLSERTYLYTEPTEIPGEREIMAAAAADPGLRPAEYYTFEGWGAANVSDEPASVYKTMPAKDLVYYAIWKCRDIRITYDPGESDGSVNGMPADNVIIAASRISEPDNPVRDGYVFIGWMTDDGKLFNFSTVIYENTKLTAVWRPKDPSGHTLIYVADGYGIDGYISYRASDQFYSGAGERILSIGEVLEKAEDVSLTKEEKEAVSEKFICWNSCADGSGTDYYAGSLYTFGDGNGVVYSKSVNEKTSVLHLKYNYPEGGLSGEDKPREDIDIKAGDLEEIDLAAVSGLNKKDKITADGKRYEFAGWSTSRYAHTEEEVEVNADRRVSINGPENTLYGVWVKLSSGYVPDENFDDMTHMPEDTSSPGAFTFPAIQIYPASYMGDGSDHTAVSEGVSYISAGGGKGVTIPYDEAFGREEPGEEITEGKVREAGMSLKGAEAEPSGSPAEELPYTGDPGFYTDDRSLGDDDGTHESLPAVFPVFFITGAYIMILWQIRKLVFMRKVSGGPLTL